jgi:hypothetical protein
LFNDRLFFPPLDYPRRILELGYGRGNWAVNMAQMYQESEVCYYIQSVTSISVIIENVHNIRMIDLLDYYQSIIG